MNRSQKRSLRTKPIIWQKKYYSKLLKGDVYIYRKETQMMITKFDGGLPFSKIDTYSEQLLNEAIFELELEFVQLCEAK